MMKTLIYIFLILILGSFVYNLVKFHYSLSILSDENQTFVIGLGAGLCGFILGLIMLKYLQLKPSLDNQSKKA